MARRTAFIVLAGLLAFASPASPVSLTPTSSPLPGSTFQGGDGNQDDPGGDVSSPPDGVADIDWQQLQRAGRVVHSPELEPDSAFSNDDKENEPGNWGFTTGTVPNKANITNVWSAVDQPGGNTFLYMAFTREATSGETHLALELNRDARLWNNGEALIPCRRDGDLVVSFDIGTKGDPEVTLQKWTTATTDLATGCALTGTFSDSSDLAANRDVQAAMSPTTIDNHLPGAPATLAEGEFGEAAINLAKIADDAFGDRCLAFSSVWMHSRSSPSANSSMQDYVPPRRLAVRTCAASGTKFFDTNANGKRDAGEPGIPRFRIWADYDNDGIWDRNEPFAITDNRGRYVIFDIQPPHGTYVLREKPLITSRLGSPIDWICSSPHAPPPAGMTDSAPGASPRCAWGPIDANATPNATGRDFGNWFPAQLTVKKQLAPSDDPGRFDLLVNGNVALAVAGNGASVTLNVPPGTYNVSEVPVGATSGGDYTSSVDCRNAVTRQQRSGTRFGGIRLVAGQQASCVFRNVRKPSPPAPTPTPDIAIVKTGPAKATAGDTLHYKLYVTNPGEVAFPQAGVHVSDAACDAPPKLDSKHGASEPDSSPATLDPGDTWIYTCANATSSDGANCEPTVVNNTAAVTGGTGSGSVNDDDSISTILLCPDQPDPTPEPIPPTPGPGPNPQPKPDQPGPVAPPGPTPPDAGDAGVAIAIFHKAIASCVSKRVPRISFRGTRIASVKVFVNGHLHRELTVRTLQRRVTPRVTVPPGRYRIVARVTFEHGSGTPPVTLVGTVRICGARRTGVRFTG